MQLLSQLFTILLIFTTVCSCSSTVHYRATGQQKEQQKRLPISSSISSCPTFALHEAVKEANLPLIRSLLENHAKVDYTDAEGFTPLMYAIKQNAPLVIEMLCDYKTDVHRLDDKKRTPLHYAVIYNSSTAVLTLLLKKGVAIDGQDDEGVTPLHYAVYSVSKNGSEDIIRFLLQYQKVHFLYT